ncbi:MAG TPA: 3'(2'),5'-bisphosphate nucleotidase CysQ [Bacteroidales bacterium]
MKELLNAAIRASLLAGKAILEVYETEFGVEFKDDNSPLTIADQRSHQIISEILKETGLPLLSEEGVNIEYAVRKNWNLFWLIDPLDGTKEFVKRNGDFTVNIALIDNNLPELGVIYVPVTDELFYGDKQNGAFKVGNASEYSRIEELKQAAIQLPLKNSLPVVVASRSHLNEDTANFINEMKIAEPDLKILSRGSSLKICMVAENKKAVYPRFAPTMEWDTAAGHAILRAAGGKIILAKNNDEELIYNKENLLNPWFIALFNSK